MKVELEGVPNSGQTGATHRHRLAGGLFALWLVMLVAGFAILVDRDVRPAPQGEAADRWPAESRLQFNRERPTLLMFVHPRCPCSRASLAELERVLAKSDDADARLVLVKPEGAPADWEQSFLAERAARLPGVTVLRDQRGAEAEMFGALASGQTFLYDTSGQLIFRGGLTAGRGHFGESASSDKLLSLLTHRGTARQVAPVYGCPLQNDEILRTRANP